ncbi:MAG: acyl-CoA thioesterase [Zoogloea sp.]|uniref:acyl-CoA thioesterase n=1 Tax=Zoogloea sp. TaxID=49181 RepID=UPI003F356E9C
MSIPQDTPAEIPRQHVLRSPMPVRWGDMDYYGHVNNTVYFRYCEQARCEWLEAVGCQVGPGTEVAPVIINASCTFLIPINYPATVVVDMFVGRPGRSSLESWYELRVEGDERVYATGAAKLVWMNPQTGSSAPIPDTVRACLV